MFRKILVPTDGSKPALRAAEILAARLAPVQGARVTVAVAIAPMDWNLTAFDIDFVKEQNKQMRANAERVLEKTTAVFAKQDIPYTTVVLEGNPVSAAIAHEACVGGYDLIAMSSRGMGKQADDLHYMGSVTEHVIRRVAIPVLVIPNVEE